MVGGKQCSNKVSFPLLLMLADVDETRKVPLFPWWTCGKIILTQVAQCKRSRRQILVFQVMMSRQVPLRCTGAKEGLIFSKRQTLSVQS